MKKLIAIIFALSVISAMAQERWSEKLDTKVTGAPTQFVGEWGDASKVLVQTYFDKKDSLNKLQVRKEGFKHGEPTATLIGTVAGDKITYANELGWSAKPEGKGMVVTGPDGFSFKGVKTNRVSPTLGAKAPKGAIVLFDGKDLSQWGAVKPKDWVKWTYEASEKAELTPEGAIRLVPGNQSLITKKDFGDVKVHLEFRLLGDVTNGGFYYMSRWEQNINDSWCQTKGNPCGAFGNIETIPAPTVNYSMPPMVWQTLDVEYTAPKFDAEGKKIANATATVSLNGETLYKNVELDKTKGAGGGGLPQVAKGPLYLQEHGTAYEFRNIWAVE